MSKDLPTFVVLKNEAGVITCLTIEEYRANIPKFVMAHCTEAPTKEQAIWQVAQDQPLQAVTKLIGAALKISDDCKVYGNIADILLEVDRQLVAAGRESAFKGLVRLIDNELGKVMWVEAPCTDPTDYGDSWQFADEPRSSAENPDQLSLLEERL